VAIETNFGEAPVLPERAPPIAVNQPRENGRSKNDDFAAWRPARVRYEAM
jgi:hypothetical protein